MVPGYPPRGVLRTTVMYMYGCYRGSTTHNTWYRPSTIPWYGVVPVAVCVHLGSRYACTSMASSRHDDGSMMSGCMCGGGDHGMGVSPVPRYHPLTPSCTSHCIYPSSSGGTSGMHPQSMAAAAAMAAVCMHVGVYVWWRGPRYGVSPVPGTIH